MSNTVFDLPMYRFCATITQNLLSPAHPLARTRDDDATIWRYPGQRHLATTDSANLSMEWR
jgi:hypothetical protein